MELCDEVDEGIEPYGIELMEHQKEALLFLDNGKILYGGVGAGKSATALAYYTQKELGKDIYVITTAKKRDSLDWVGEGARFGIGRDRSSTTSGVLTIDSWNNIGTYTDIEGAFFIFDEQRLVGHGAWVKSFLKIAQRNHWIMLTATPGDHWLDYAPVFIANGWYKNITEFKREHVIYAPYRNFPMVKGYIGVAKLTRLRENILVEMPYRSSNTRILNYLEVGYNEALLDVVVKKRWNPYEGRPIKDAGEYFRLMRRVVNSDPSRLELIRMLLKVHPRLIIFYNFDYELDILRDLGDEIVVAEWNGHNHQPVPDTEKWAYLVQYNSGAESWNCITTDAMVLYSLTYSYKNYIQSMGRIDRLDSIYHDLYYYVLGSGAKIDGLVKKALGEKRSFNEREFIYTGDFSASAGGVDGEMSYL